MQPLRHTWDIVTFFFSGCDIFNRIIFFYKNNAALLLNTWEIKERKATNSVIMVRPYFGKFVFSLLPIVFTQ